MSEGDATRCICVLLLSNRKYLSKEEAARYLRYVPWAERDRRHIPPGQPGSFAEVELEVRNDEQGPRLAFPGPKDSLAALIAFGGNKDGEHGITVSLAHFVKSFYGKEDKEDKKGKEGLQYLHEIRVSEEASGRLQDGLYHLFWNNERADEKAPSDEMTWLLQRFARPRRAQLGELWQQHGTYLLSEYEYEYGVVHPPYASALAMRQPRAEILHPVFVERRRTGALRIGHVTDTHVDVRADVYEENLKRAREKLKFSPDAQKRAGLDASYNNWNTSFVRVYNDAKRDSDVLMLTGDLIDYGRGHWGTTAADRLGDDEAYHVDRNWFLFYYLLASGESYTRPVYTILGNHDWRLNPYPPFAVAGAPSTKSLIHDYARFNDDQRDEILRTAHGPGHEKKFSYYFAAENKSQLVQEKPADALKALARMIGQTKTMDEPHSPAETTVESIAWYLLSINPFLDYRFTLPSRQQVLMLDWAEDEDVLFPITVQGKEWPYMLWQASAAADPGPKARNCLTDLQKHHVEDFAAGRGAAKIIGVHAPPIGPYPDWYDDDLLRGRKTYDRPKDARGPTHYATRKPDGSIEKWNGHPLFAIGPADGALGMAADYGSFEKKRDWFIKRVAERNSGVRIVLSGHIHRNGLHIVHVPSGGADSAVAGQMLIKGVVEPATRGARPPAVTLTPEGTRGPLYINTTSAGPRGHYHPRTGQTYYVDPGYAHVELADDGIIQQVEFRLVRAGVSQPAMGTRSSMANVPQSGALVGVG